jgi:hypothetical protein
LNRSFLTAAIATALALLTRTSAAADPPVVRLAPTGSLDLAGTPLLPDQTLPASKSIIVEVPYPGTNDANAKLEVWPKLGRDDCSTYKSGTLQHYRLSMSASGTGSDRVLRATVPALQVRQSYCFAFAKSSALSDEQASQMVSAATASIFSTMKAQCNPSSSGPRVDAGVVQATFRAEIANAMADLYRTYAPNSKARQKTSVDVAADIAARKFGPDGLGKCAAYMTRVAETKAQADPATAAAAGKPPTPAAPASTALSARELAISNENAANAALLKAISDALSADEVRAQLRVEIDQTPISSSAGEGTTTDNSNYVSVDAGLMVAIPTRFYSDTTAWLLPYLGLNLYAVPVDRSVDLDKLVGCTVPQRLSLTLGLTLVQPTLGNKKIAPIVFDRLPLAAIGYRVVPYGRIALGGVFYNLADPNPASTRTKLSFAPSFSGSLDFDVIQLFASRL